MFVFGGNVPLMVHMLLARFFMEQEQIARSYYTKEEEEKKKELFCTIGDFSLEATVEGLYIIFCTIIQG